MLKSSKKMISGNMFKYFLIAFLVRIAIGIVPDSVTSIGKLSLPNLLEIKDIFELESGWSFYNSIKFDTGRLLISKLGGSIWSKNRLTTADDEWTIEFMFRSSGKTQDLVFTETNGLSLFLVQSPNIKDYSNFGGPSEFDGFQFLMNNKEKQGLKIYVNDGTKRIENRLDNAIGNCEFPYINSQIPFTIRVSYSKSQGIFKVQMDNNLCFRTDKIVIPSSSYHIGVAGNISPASEEVFEVFLLNYWDHLTEDAIDDHGLISDGELKVSVRKIVDGQGEEEGEEEQQNKFHSPSAVRESLMERNRKFMEQLQEEAEAENSGSETAVFAKLVKQNEFIVSKLESMEATIGNLKIPVTDSSASSFEEFKTTLSRQYVELLESIAKLNQKVIGEVREQQSTIDELTRKMDVLMANHKELNFQTKESSKVNTYEGTGNALRFTLFVIIIILVVLAIGFYRLRRDVKHSKLL